MLNVDIDIPIQQDIAQLEEWRRRFATADLELPEGYAGDGVATAVALDTEGKLIGSLTASIIIAASLDPLLLNPDADHTSKFASTFALERAMAWQAKMNGAAAGFVAIPNLLPDYQKFIERFGYVETAQHCKVYRRSFLRKPSPTKSSLAKIEK